MSLQITNWIVATRKGGIKCANWEDVKRAQFNLQHTGASYTTYYRHSELEWVEMDGQAWIPDGEVNLAFELKEMAA
jgi:hypothetical protein